MTELAISICQLGEKRKTAWVVLLGASAPHTNDPHIVNRILSPRSKVRRELMSNYSRGGNRQESGDARLQVVPLLHRTPLLKEKRPFRAQSEYTLSMGHLHAIR